jgi:hypothetical protein
MLAETTQPVKVVVESPPHYFEAGIIIFLFFTLFLFILNSIKLYRHLSQQTRESLEKLHSDHAAMSEKLQNRHASERKEWNSENKRSVQQVEAVLRDLTGAIKSANTVNVQTNTGPSVGTQGQVGHNHG